MKKYAIGVDIGGSHISSAVIDLELNRILKNTYANSPVDNKADADNILKIWYHTLQQSYSCINHNEFAGIGFAMPGPFNYPEGIAMFTHEVVKYEKLNGINISSYISDNFGFNDSIAIRFMNDASAFAVGEAWLGKAKDAKKSVCITLGTGFGSAFIDEGLPVVERNDVPRLGCVWHLPFGESIGDDYFSTRGVIKRYKELTAVHVAGAKDVAERIGSDPSAGRVFNEYGNGLALFLSPWLNKFGAEALVIGGNISSAYNVFGSEFEKELSNHGIQISIHISELMEDAAIIGSARMLDPAFWEKMKVLIGKM